MTDQSPTRLTVIRHGESNVTVEGRFGGTVACSGLSPLGRTQAERLRDRFATGDEIAVDALWASQLPRAIETAKILNEALGLELQIDAGFEEMRPGDADGMRFADYVEQYGYPDQLADPWTPLAPNAESRASFHLRIGVAFDRLLRTFEGQSIVVVCHGGVVDAVFRQLLRLPRDASFQLHTMNTSLTELVTVSHDSPPIWRLARYNDAAHLAGLPHATRRA